MTKTKTSARKTAETAAIAPVEETAVETTATSITEDAQSAIATTDVSTIETAAVEVVDLPINTDAQAAFSAFTARPFVAAVISALVKVKDGFLSVLEEEKEHNYGLSFVQWLWSIFSAVVLPVLALLWLALNKGYVWARKEKTAADIKAKWQVLRTWFAPQHDYEQGTEDEGALKL